MSADEDVFDVRCHGGALHFKLVEGLIEVKCDRPKCTEGGKYVVLHRYSVPDCELVETLKKKPVFRGPRAQHPRKDQIA